MGYNAFNVLYTYTVLYIKITMHKEWYFDALHMQASCKAFHIYMNMYMRQNRLCSFTQVCCVV